MTRCWLAILVPAVCLVGIPSAAGPRRAAAAPPETAPATSPAIPHDLALLVAQLGDDDPQARDAASRRLAAMGKAALPALRAAAAGDDPEVAGRARGLIAGFRYGIGPDTPAEILELVNQYRSGQPTQRQRAVQQLGNMTWGGYRVLAKLHRQESDPAWREMLAGSLRAGAPGVLNVARELIAGGHEEEAEARLAEAAAGGEGLVSRSYAALLLARGRLDAAVRELESDAGDAPGSEDALLLARLCRAKGDADAVLRYAARVGPQPGYPWGAAEALRREALLDRHDWPKLIEMAQRKLDQAEEGGDNGGPRVAVPGVGGAPAVATFRPNGDPIRRAALAEKAAFARLGGQAKALDEAVSAMRGEAEQTPTAGALYANALLLNERYVDAINVLVAARDYVTAFRLLAARGRHEEALRLVDAARADQWDNLPLLELTAAESLASLGDKEQAERIVDRVVKDLDPAKAGTAEAELVRAELAVGRNDKAFERAAAALQAPGYRSNPAAAMALLVPNFPDSAQRWRAFLLAHHRGAPDAEVLGKVWGLFARKLPAGETEALLRDATHDAAGIGVAAIRDPWFEAIADAARAAGRDDLADAAFEKMAAVSDGWFPWKYLGDRAARRQDWPRAVECYGNARQKDPAEPICLWLDGWARRQAAGGPAAVAKDAKDANDSKNLTDAPDAAEEMRRADELLLADDTKWAGFEQAIVEAGADATGDAEPQRELLRRVTDPAAWAHNESYHASARALLTAGKRWFEVEDPLEEQAADPQGGPPAGEPPATAPAQPAADRYLRAADLMARWLIPMASGNMIFRQPGAYLGQPASVHITRARGLVESGDVAAAMKEADAALAAMPANTQLPIDLCPALDRRGHKAEADALFGKVAAANEAALDRHPDCAELHNGMAWMGAKCDRDLDKALGHAERATKLSPDAVAYLDTLAETHWRRGERQAAIDVMKKCIELDPHFEYLQRQMKRFTAGDGGKATTGPATLPGR